MAITFRRGKDHEAEPSEHSGGWYPDPYGAGARRWYDNASGWSERVQEAGQAPDKTGLIRLDEAAAGPDHPIRRVDEHGKLVPLSRSVDPHYLADA